MRRIVLVTGASGFVGQALVPYLARAGWHVRAASRIVARSWPAGVEAVIAPDLSRTDTTASELAWHPLVEGASHVVHLAGIAHQTKAIPPSVYDAVNATAVGVLAQAARAAGVSRMVLLSSIRAQSGPVADHPLTERDPALPTDAYGKSKLGGEQALADRLSGSATEPVILRPVVIYGRGAKGNMATLARLARSRLPAPFAGLAARRSVLALDNLNHAIQHALNAPGLAGHAYIVADPSALTLAEMMAALRAGLGRSPGLVPLDAALLQVVAGALGRRTAFERITGGLEADIGKLIASGWRPRFGAEVGLYRWMRENSRI